ncbi:MAG: AmmeMemoRadiSam system protein A, partial [Turicibacter sp.]
IGRREQGMTEVLPKGSNPYVRLARKCLEDYFTQTKTMIAKEELPEIMVAHRHGVFVSLKKDGQLRGCIGTIFPTTDCVASEIIRNAIAAATEDPRFIPVRFEELKQIQISVDVLMTPTSASIEELDPKRYGVIVSKGMRKGVLLPNLEGVESVDDQLAIACQKAGINPDGDFDIEKFEVIRYKEGER